MLAHPPRTVRRRIDRVDREGYAAGEIDVVIDSEFALSDAGQAQDKMLSSDFFGKIILKP